MAATLTSSGELTYASFPIDKIETDADGDLIVYGKASDGGLDSDQQIVDPQWMASAAQAWKASGANLRVQHNAQRDPAGIGLEVETDAQGATWVKGLVVEPVAKRLVAKGALRAYSVGIARPTIQRDVSAPNGRITNGELVEISLVDRPANKRATFQLVKAEGGVPEYTGKLFGTEEDIAKALGADVEKSDTLTVDSSSLEDMSLTFTPNDLMRIVQNKFVERHYDELASKAIADAEFEITKRDIDTATRRSLAGQGHALPDGSYPIANTEDLHNAAVLARSGHGNVSGARALIARRAKELGVSNPLSDTDNDKIEGDVTPKEADPVVTKDPASKKPKKGGKKMPPWLNSGDGDGDADDKGSSDSGSDCKMDHAHTEKCHPSGTPKSTSGAKDAADMQEIPNTGPAPESPMPAGRKTPDTKAIDSDVHSSPEMAAQLRFKTVGIDAGLGILHDLTCAAYHPDEVSKYHPYSDFKNTVDESVFQRKALEAAAGKSLPEAMEMQAVWQAARTLKTMDPAVLNDVRLEMHKAFRDANPGPSSYPSPGSMSPGKFKRPVITGGHADNSPGYGAPNSSPMVASGPSMGAGNYDRPPLSSGHQSPSPSFMKGGFEVPVAGEGPTKLTYRHMEKEQAIAAVNQLHTHLSSVVPNVCSMDMNSRGPLTPNPATTAVGLGKGEEVEKAVPAPAGITKAPVEDDMFSEEYLEKAFKKMRKKLGKKVLAGKMTVDEARSKIGRMGAQKSDDDDVQALVDQVDKGVLTIDEARAKLGLGPWNMPETTKAATVEPVAENKATEPDLIKSAVEAAISPLQEMIAAQQKAFEGKLAEQQKVIDAIADAPDPRGEPYSGYAVNPIKKSARPVGVPDATEIAERTQQMMIRQLEHTWRSSDNPAEREAAWNAISKFRGITD